MKKLLSMALMLMMILSLLAVPTMAADDGVKFFEDFEGYTVENGKFTDASGYWSIPNDGVTTGADGTGYAIGMAYESSRQYRDQYSGTKKPLTLPAGDYTFSVKVKVYPVVAGTSIDNLVLRTFLLAQTSSNQVQLPDVPLTTEWQTISQDFTLTKESTYSGTKAVQMYVVGTVAKQVYVYFDDVTITEKAAAPEPTEYAVTINTDANAITSVAAATSEGEAVNFTAKPKFGYYIASITIGGEAFTGFDAYKGGTYSTGEIAADTAIVVTVAALSANTEEGVATEVATLPSVFAPAADSAVTFGKVLDNTGATSWGVELTKDGVGVTPANGGSYLYKANATNANGQYAIEFVGLEAGTYQIRSYIYVDGTAVFGAPTTFVVD